MPEFAALVSDQAVNEGLALVQCQFNATGFACVQKQANTFYRAIYGGEKGRRHVEQPCLQHAGGGCP